MTSAAKTMKKTHEKHAEVAGGKSENKNPNYFWENLMQMQVYSDIILTGI